MAELTACLDLSTWPAGTRAIGRREEPHPGAQFNLFDPDGYRHQVLITNSQDLDIAYLEARHRGHARVEDRIRWGKALGLENFPFSTFSSNSVWLMVVMLAQDLLAWAQRLCLEGPLASAEPKRLRYALWHTPGTSGAHRPAADIALGRQLALGPGAGPSLPTPEVPAALPLISPAGPRPPSSNCSGRTTPQEGGATNG